MYRIREVDGQDDDISDTLVELHCLTFFDGAHSGVRPRTLVAFTRQSRSPSRVLFPQPMFATPAIFVARRVVRQRETREVAEQAGHQTEHQQPPSALVTIMQPFGMDGETPHQPGMKTTTTATIKREAARPAAVIKMAPTNKPAMPKTSVDFQCRAR